MKIKTLSQLYGYNRGSSKPRVKKLTPEALRKMVMSEVYTALNEQDEAATEETETSEEVTEPKGTKFDSQTSFKGVDAAEVAAQILTRDPAQPFFQAMAGEHAPSVDATADWLEGIGVETFIQRVGDVGSKIPGSGLPKSEMPFLPGPDDAQGSVEDVEDALSPGGEYNVNFVESKSRQSFKRGLRYLVEQEVEAKEEEETTEEVPSVAAPPKNSFIGLASDESQAYMTGGHEEKDGKPDDDSIGIQVGGSFAAGEGIPTQTNILLPKAVGMAVNGVSGGDLEAYASMGNEILDGHHRWAATMLNDPGASIGTIAKIDMDTLGMMPTLKHLTAIGNALGNKTKTESRQKKTDKLVLEKWQRMAGLLK